MKGPVAILKFILLPIAAGLLCSTLFAQSSKDIFTLSSGTSVEAEVALLRESVVSINGKTSINTFTCSNYKQITSYSDRVQLNKQNDDWILDGAFLEIYTTGFDCGIKGLTEDFKDLLEVDNYPHIKIEVLSWQSLESEQLEVLATTLTTISGVTREIQFPIQIKRIDNQLECTGSTTIDITDFNIDPPRRLLGLIKVNKKIQIAFKVLMDIKIKADTIPSAR